jgi:hypothetical protein
MAYTAPTTRVTGELITAAIWNTDMVDNIIFLNANLGTSFATLTNGSGGTRTANDLVVWNTASDTEFTTSTAQADHTIAGVVSDDTISNGASGLVQVAGRRTVKTNGAVARGDGLRQSTSITESESCDYNANGCFAVALTTSGGGSSTVECLLLLPAQWFISAAANRSSAISITASAFRNLTLTTEDHDTDSMFTPTSQRITIPSDGDGEYETSYRIQWSGSAGVATRQGRVLLNAGTQIMFFNGGQPSSGVSPLTSIGSDKRTFSAGDTLDLQALTTATENVDAAEFSVTRVGRV